VSSGGLQFSAVRFTDLPALDLLIPTEESVGYYQSSASPTFLAVNA
jgi:hypothetical protein